MINIDIRAPALKDIQGAIRRIDNNSLSMLTRAINRGAITAKTAIGKTSSGVPSAYRIKTTEVNAASKITQRAVASNPIAIVTIKGRPRPLVKFTVTPKRHSKRKGKSGTPRHYRSAVKKKNGLKPLSNSKNKPFFAKTKNGEEGIFSRQDSKIQKQIKIFRRTKKGVKVYKYTNKKDGSPYTVDKLQMHFGPSVPHMVQNEKIMDSVQKAANSMIENRLNHELDMLLRRL